MTRIEVLEREVENLTPEELAAFREWFVEHDWNTWDRELKEDIAAGKLDRFADEVLEEEKLGKTTEL
ncbi:MAG TPA: hypothetical protein VG323_22110 [Thermoanaerobaculia bacterium]|nr:hypothetical protein [Thermoanaerobaculia bacterium]